MYGIYLKWHSKFIVEKVDSSGTLQPGLIAASLERIVSWGPFSKCVSMRITTISLVWNLIRGGCGFEELDSAGGLHWAVGFIELNGRNSLKGID